MSLFVHEKRWATQVKAEEGQEVGQVRIVWRRVYQREREREGEAEREEKKQHDKAKTE